MKKSKLSILAALMLTLGVVGCGEDPGNNPGGDDPVVECSHDYTGAEFQKDDTNHWKKCTKCGEDGKATKHNYKNEVADQTGVTRATCGVDGQVKKQCECGAIGLVTEKKTGNHNYVDLGEQAEGYVAPTCGVAGVMPQACSVCGGTKTRAIDPTGNHSFRAVTASDDVGDHQAVTGSCVDDGVELKICDVCHQIKEEASKATGHNYVDVAGSEVAAAGALTYKYTQCSKCGGKRLIWAPTEATAESQAHLSSNCTKLGGNPMGLGSDKKYDATKEGDYYEFVFKSPVTQNVTLGAMLTPNSSAKSNSVGVWKCGDPSKDNSPGWRAKLDEQGQPTGEGEMIDDWRYIVKVNGTEVAPKEDFEDIITGDKGWYNSPYTFAVAEGQTYTIKIIQCSGYRSTFESFGFEFEGARGPIAEFNGAKISWGSKAFDPTRTSTDITTDAGILMDTAYNVGTKNDRSKATPPATIDDISVGQHAVYNVRADKAYNGAVLEMVASRSTNLPSGGKAFSYMSNDWYPGYIYHPEAAGTEEDPIFTLAPARFSLLINDVEVPFDLTAEGYQEPVYKSLDTDTVIEFPQDINLVEGINRIELRCMGGYEVTIKSFNLIPFCDHNYEILDDETHVNVPVDCVTNGVTFKKCSKCDKIIEINTTKLGHNYVDIPTDEEHINVAATCTDKGTQYQQCDRCQDIKSTSVSALGHKYNGDLVEDESHVRVAPGIASVGKEYRKCTNAGCSEVGEAEIAQLGFDTSSGTEVPATESSIAYISGSNFIKFNADAGTYAEGSKNTSNLAEGYVKLSANGQSISYNINLTAGVTGKLYVVCRMDNYSRYASRGIGYNSQAQDTYEVAQGAGEFAAVNIEAAMAKTYQDSLGKSVSTDEGFTSYSNLGFLELGDIAFASGANTFRVTRNNKYDVTAYQYVIVFNA